MSYEEIYKAARLQRLSKAGAGPRAAGILRRLAGNPKAGTDAGVHTSLLTAGNNQASKDTVLRAVGDRVNAGKARPKAMRDANWAAERARRAAGAKTRGLGDVGGAGARNRFSNAANLTQASTVNSRATRAPVSFRPGSRGEALRTKVNRRQGNYANTPNAPGDFMRARVARQSQMRLGG